jgi:ketosteroid isomerase-like protein
MNPTTCIVLPVILAGALTVGGAETREAERTALFRVDEAWAQAAAAKDLEKTLSFWSEDASVLPPGQAAVVGKEAIRRYVSEGFALPGFAIRWKTSEFVVSASGDMAYGVGTNEMTVNDAQGRPMTQRGRGITVWRRDGKGGWKCVVDIWNPEPQLPAAK